MATQKMRELSLFSGGGGGILASHLLGWELKGCAEWDEGARGILEARVADGSIPDVTLHKDVQQLDPTEYIGEVDIVTGGFPCQPFSNAGKKLGVDDPRNMWPHTVRILKGTEAPYGYFENVASLLGSGYFGTVLKDLIEAGFHVSWDCVPASAVGAPHIRDRLWIFARKVQEGDPVIEPGSLPLLTVATLENGAWNRTTGNATWTETDDLGEPAKWPRAGVAIGNIAHAIPRSGFPEGVRKYGVWPMCRLPWVPVTNHEDPVVSSVWPTPMAINYKTTYRWRDNHQNDLTAAVANPDKWATPRAVDAKNASLPPSEAGRDGVVGDVMRAMGAEDTRRGKKAQWPTPTVMDGLRVEQVRTPEEIEEARKDGGCRNLREEAVWSTPTTMDALPPKTQEVLDREATEVRPGRNKASNLRDQVNVEAGNVDWKGKETFPTPTATERSGVNPKTGKGGGLTHEIKQREMYPTPLANVDNRKSAKSLRRTKDGGQSTPPGLAQHAELKEGIIPREYEGIPFEELPPKVQAMWPTPTVTNAVSNHGYQKSGDNYYPTLSGAAGAAPGPGGEMWPTPTQGMHKQDVNDSGEYAQRVRDSGFQEMLPVAVKLRDGEEPEMWPTPRTSGGSRPNGKGGKVLNEEVQIAEGVRKRGEYVDGRSIPTPTVEDAGRAGSAEAWEEYEEEGKTTGARLRNYAQKFPTPCAGTNGRSTYPGRNVVNSLLRGEEPKHQPLTIDIVMYEELKERGVKEVLSFKDGLFILEDGERVMWPTPSAMDGARRGKAIDPDHWLEARDRHAEKGVNKHLSLDVAVAFEDQGRSPKEKRDVTEEVGEALSPSPVEEMFENERWPTPLASDWKGANLKEGATSASATGLASTAARRDKAKFQTPTASDAKAAGNDGFSPLGRQLDAAPKKAGLLNPEWVSWLMGWPIGWTSPEPMPEGGLQDWLAQNHRRMWWRQEPEGLPRLTQKHETAGSRTARLKALGNGQVSLCCARSYEVLRFTLEEVLNKVKEGEQEVSLNDFFGF